MKFTWMTFWTALAAIAALTGSVITLFSYLGGTQNPIDYSQNKLEIGRDNYAPITNTQKNVSSENGGVAIGGDNYGPISIDKNRDLMEIQVKPSINIKVIKTSENPFLTDFSIENSGKIDAKLSVVVKYFEYIEKSGAKIIYNGNINDINSLLRDNIILDAGGGNTEIKFSDLVTFEKNKKALSKNLNFYCEGCVYDKDDKIFLADLSNSNLENLQKSLICFNLNYQWKLPTEKVYKEEAKPIGFVIDKSIGFDFWKQRTELCETKNNSK